MAVVIIESMLSDKQLRETYLAGTPLFNGQVREIETIFGPQNTNNWRSVTTKQFNPIYYDQIVSVFFATTPPYLDALNPAVVGRKFFMNKKWVYDKVYLFTHEAICDLPYPKGSWPLGIGYMVNVYGQPGEEELNRYKCVYFLDADHKKVEEWAGHELPKGKYSTFYAATYDTLNGANRRLRVKTYTYDDQTLLSDWDVSWMQHAKQNKVI